MPELKKYTMQELVQIISQLEKSETQLSEMAKRLKDKVKINQKEVWISGYSNQELYESYVNALEREGIIVRVDHNGDCPLLCDYLQSYFETYKTHQQQNTIVNRDRIVRNHILPKFGNYRLDMISTSMIQTWFNDLAKEYSKETIAKIKNTLSPVFDSAVEDDLIARNPLKSKRIENNGREVEHHKALSHEKIQEIKLALPQFEPKVRYMGGLLCYTGMRYEEVLGARFEDISKDGWLTICRAVVHPKRNMPVLKCTKTQTSDRIIPCPDALKELLSDGPKEGFIMATDKDPSRETPMSYTEARRVFDKFKKAFNITEYSPHDFRDTCATEWRENGVPLDVIARMLGHAKTETTERRYVKYRTEILDNVRNMM